MMIDVTKPLRLADGTPVEFCHFDSDGDIVVRLRGAIRVFENATGRHWLGELPDLQNVPEQDIDDKRVRDAAPDLLAALKDYRSQFGQALDCHGIAYGPAQKAADEAALAAIARAEGGAS